jgi:hypothetical protein
MARTGRPKPLGSARLCEGRRLLSIHAATSVAGEPSVRFHTYPPSQLIDSREGGRSKAGNRAFGWGAGITVGSRCSPPRSADKANNSI